MRKRRPSTRWKCTLFQLRRRTSVKQRQFAKLAGISEALLRDIENGREVATPDELARVAKTIGLPIESILIPLEGRFSGYLCRVMKPSMQVSHPFHGPGFIISVHEFHAVVQFAKYSQPIRAHLDLLNEVRP